MVFFFSSWISREGVFRLIERLLGFVDLDDALKVFGALAISFSFAHLFYVT